ncbi:elongation factor P 5-aminopentanone reductase [Paenibacillus assamensis]|uniref:elongation factor P 5-aminopentanone reductase n=1 Tax=Paenibacillus assamensis TaxID=311244 RepID=UPI00048A8018|nr:SDR family oxidoreductase [Paenibacillus assamensis]
MKALSETTVLITGGSRGIGAATAERFAAEGARIAIHYHQAHEAANEVARRCMARGSEVLTVAADIRSREQLMRMKEQLDIHGFAPDILVNNAGSSTYGLFTDVTDEEWEDCMSVNLKGPFRCTQLFVPHMIRQQYGRIINVSSIWGVTGASCEVLYSTAKGGVNAFTKGLAKELAPSGITVNAVAPGAVQTDMLSHLATEDKAALETEIPAGRLGTPQEIASLIYFLSLPESAYINGQIISPNGGWLT